MTVLSQNHPQALNLGRFITFEGTEGAGKSTQIQRLALQLRSIGRTVRLLREPGGTALGEELRHTLKHSHAGREMAPEAELLLMNASRAQLVREVIRPAIAAGETVLCDRFFDSTIAYQGYGRGLPLDMVRSAVAIAVGGTLPDLTVMLEVPVEVSETRRRHRMGACALASSESQASSAQGSAPALIPARVVPQAHGAAVDRFEVAEREFFVRVELGFAAILQAEPERVRRVDGRGREEEIAAVIWGVVKPLFGF